MESAFWISPISVVTVILCGAAAYGWARRHGERDPWVGALAVSLPFLLAVAVGAVVLGVTDGGDDIWTINRLSPSFALAHGYDLYREADRSMLSWMYGPVGLLAYLPFTLLATPVPVIVASEIATFAFVFAPLSYALVREVRGAARVAGVLGPRRLFLGSVLTTVLLYLLGARSLYYVATRVHVDAVALGLCAAAMLVLVRRPSYRSLWSQGVASLLVSLALWTKASVLPVPVAMALYVLARHGWRQLLRFGVVLTAVFAVVSGVILGLVDLDGLRYVLLEQPASCKWWQNVYEPPTLACTEPGARFSLSIFAATFFSRMGEVTVYCLPLLVTLGLLIGLAKRASRDLGRALRQCHGPWVLPLLAAILSVPASVAARVKIGGDLNSFAPVEYFLLLAVLMLMTRVWLALETKPAVWARRLLMGYPIVAGGLLLVALEHPAPSYVPSLSLEGMPVWSAAAGLGVCALLLWVGQRWRRSLLVGCLILGFGFLPGIGFIAHRVEDQIAGMENSILVQAYGLAAAHPGRTYFPELPLVHLLVAGRVRPSAVRLHDRSMMSTPMQRREMEEVFPEPPRLIGVIAEPEYEFLDATGIVQSYFTGYQEAPRMPEADELVVYRRPGSPGGSRPRGAQH